MVLVREPNTGLWHDDSIRYPINYGRELVDLDTLIRRELSNGILPEYQKRIVNVIIWHEGDMGVGDGWRPTPSNTSEASKRGESFHQDQRYWNGAMYWSGADMVCRNPNGWGVHVAPPLAEIPVQGTAAAIMFGIHANVGTPGKTGFESWHAQCIEQDGWLSWVLAGRQYPQPAYPFPRLYPDTPTYPTNPPQQGEDLTMVTIDDARVYAGHNEAPRTLFAIQTGMKGKKAVQATVTVIASDQSGYLSVNGETSFCTYHAGIGASENRNFKVQADGNILFGSKTPVRVCVDITGYDL